MVFTKNENKIKNDSLGYFKIFFRMPLCFKDDKGCSTKTIPLSCNNILITINGCFCTHCTCVFERVRQSMTVIGSIRTPCRLSYKPGNRKGPANTREINMSIFYLQLLSRISSNLRKRKWFSILDVHYVQPHLAMTWSQLNSKLQEGIDNFAINFYWLDHF